MRISKGKFLVMPEPIRFVLFDALEQSTRGSWSFVDFVNDGLNGMEHAIVVLSERK